MSSLEIFAVVISAISVWLATRQSIWYWPSGIASVLTYAWIFFHARLYADAGLQIVYLLLIAYGWYQWLHGGEKREPLGVSRTPRWAWVVVASAGTAFAVALGWWLNLKTDASLPFWDAGTASFSIAAQWMTARKWIDNWIVWIVVDVVYVGMYVYKELLPTAVLYAGFIVLAAIGYRAWSSSLGVCAVEAQERRS